MTLVRKLQGNLVAPPTVVLIPMDALWSVLHKTNGNKASVGPTTNQSCIPQFLRLLGVRE